MGSPNIIFCYANLNEESDEQADYETFQAAVKSAAQKALGPLSQYVRVIPLHKNYSPKSNQNVQWYKGPSLLEMIAQSNQFLPPLTLKQALAKPCYVRFDELGGRGAKIFMTIAGVDESPKHGLIMPYTPWTGELTIVDALSYNNRYYPVPLRYFPELFTTGRPGNCLVSITVLQNTLRNHFQNEIYFIGMKRFIHIHLLFDRIDGKINFLPQFFPGDTCFAVATIAAAEAHLIPNMVAPGADPKHKNAYGKFFARDHDTEVFYGVVLAYDKHHQGDFFEGDVPNEYHVRNALRRRRLERAMAKKEERKKTSLRAKRRAAREAKAASKIDNDKRN